MIHITGMGILGSFLAWELHYRSIPFTWWDNQTTFCAWRACTGCIFPTGEEEDMENYCTWVVRREMGCPWQQHLGSNFLEEAGYWFLTKNPPHCGDYVADRYIAPLYCGSLRSMHFNAQAFVIGTQKFFADKCQVVCNRAQEIVAHGFNYRLTHYVWGWTVPVVLHYPEEYTVDGLRPCLYMRKGSFFQYAYPVPGTKLWYAGSSLIKNRRLHDYEIEPKIDTWLRWLDKFTNGKFRAEVVGKPVAGWRPRGLETDTKEANRGEVDERIYVRPHWHDGVRNGPSIIAAVLKEAGIQ